MNILLVEDDILVAKLIASWIAKYSAKSEVYIADNLEDAKSMLNIRDYDLILLDLNLGGEDGFELLLSGKKRECEVIVVSSFHNKALEAYDFSVLDFVSKPIKESRFKQALDRFMCLYNSAGDYNRFVTTSYGGITKTIETATISYVKADGHYCQIYDLNNDVTLCDKSIDKLHHFLSDKFDRIHRSFLVNRNKIKGVKSHGAGKYSVLVDNHEVPMSRAYYLENYKKVVINWSL